MMLLSISINFLIFLLNFTSAMKPSENTEKSKANKNPAESAHVFGHDQQQFLLSQSEHQQLAIPTTEHEGQNADIVNAQLPLNPSDPILAPFPDQLTNYQPPAPLEHPFPHPSDHSGPSFPRNQFVLPPSSFPFPPPLHPSASDHSLPPRSDQRILQPSISKSHSSNLHTFPSKSGFIHFGDPSALDFPSQQSLSSLNLPFNEGNSESDVAASLRNKELRKRANFNTKERLKKENESIDNLRVNYVRKICPYFIKIWHKILEKQHKPFEPLKYREPLKKDTLKRTRECIIGLEIFLKNVHLEENKHDQRENLLKEAQANGDRNVENFEVIEGDLKSENIIDEEIKNKLQNPELDRKTRNKKQHAFDEKYRRDQISRHINALNATLPEERRSKIKQGTKEGTKEGTKGDVLASVEKYLKELHKLAKQFPKPEDVKNKDDKLKGKLGDGAPEMMESTRENSSPSKKKLKLS